MLRSKGLSVTFLVLVACVRWSGAVQAQSQDAAELAKQLTNPVASLISVPFQFNYDARIGPVRDGESYYLRFQPVIPVSLDKDWNVISRTIVPVTRQFDIFPGAGDQFGFGDITQSFFFSPKAPGPGGFVWGAGPALLIPSDSDPLLSSEKWGAGPTGVALVLQGPWTVGILANHIWSYAGSSTRPDVNATFLQPFIAYTTKDAWTYTLNSESTYDWVAEQWSVPINFQITKLLKIGTQPVSIGGGVRYWAANPDTGAHDFGARLIVTLLFPTQQK